MDAYIAKAAPFAQPILTRVREVAHKACPDLEEEIKWGMPFFVLRGVILGHMAAFKQHCAVGFWGPEMHAILREDGLLSEDGMGALGKVSGLKDLPSDRKLLNYYRQAAGLVASGQRTKSIVRPRKSSKPAPEVLRNWPPRSRRTRLRRRSLQVSVHPVSVSTPTGSPKPSDLRRGKNASRRR